MEGEKMVAKVIRVHASKYPIEGEKSNSNSNFPIYLYIYIYTHTQCESSINSLFSLLALRIGEEERNKLHVSIRYLWCTSAALA